MSKEEKISKFLSFVLRHRPQTIGLVLDENGWADMVELMSRASEHGTNMNESDIREVVRNSDKQRFIFSDDGKRIRANQGHSVKVDLQLPAKIPPAILYHGTATRFLESILDTGLNAGNRLHVHLSTTLETAQTVGARHGSPVILAVKSGEMAEKGIPFYLSENGVWLCESVAAQYLSVLE